MHTNICHTFTQVTPDKNVFPRRGANPPRRGGGSSLHKAPRGAAPACNSQVLISQTQCVEVRSTGSSETSHVTTDQEIPAKTSKTGSFDIGYFLDNEAKASNFQKRCILTTKWTLSSANFVWPSSSKNIQGKLSKRSVMQSHIDCYQQFAYSEKLKGLFCKICVLGYPRLALPVTELICSSWSSGNNWTAEV